MSILEQFEEQYWKQPLYPAELFVAHASIDSAPTTKEFISAQATDSFYRQVAGTVSTSVAGYSFHKDNFLDLYAPLDGALPKFVPNTLQATILYLSLYPVMADNPNTRRMYDNIMCILTARTWNTTLARL